MSVEHIKFLDQQRRYHCDGKSIDVLLGDKVYVDSFVGYLQAVKGFHIRLVFIIFQVLFQMFCINHTFYLSIYLGRFPQFGG